MSPAPSYSGFPSSPFALETTPKIDNSPVHFYRAVAIIFLLLLIGAVAPLAANASPTGPTVSTFSLPQGSPSLTQTVTVQIATGGTLTAVNVVTQGATGLDFTDAQTNDNCTVGQTYSNTSCTMSVQFKPKAPGKHFGAIVLTFNNGSTTTQYLYGYSLGSLGVIIPGLINTVAGSANSLYIAGASDGIAATTAPIQLPRGELVDATGNLYISDWGNSRIRKVDTENPGIISTFAGGGSTGVITPGLAATAATIEVPSGLAMDGAGNLYFADSGASLIYMVDHAGVISIVAGMQGTAGYRDGAVLQAELTQPNGLAIDANENLYIADTGNNLIRKIDLKVDPANRQIVTIAGTLAGGFGGDGSSASSAIFSQPWGLAVGPDGLLYIADVNNNVIRRIDPTGTGPTATVVGIPTSQGSFGGDGGAANQANLQTPEGVVVDLAGNIYVADTQNNVIRKATVQPMGGYTISTISGSPQNQTFSGDTANADLATMSSPSSLTLDAAGNLYFGDLFHNRVRMISSQSAFLQYGQIKDFNVSAAKTEIFENDGNATMTVGQIALVNATLDGTSTCQTNGTLALAVSCLLNIEFAPQVQNLPPDPQELGVATPGSVTIASDAANSPGIVNLSGLVLNVNPTKTTLVSTPNPSSTGASVMFTSTVSNSNSGPVTGTITFLDGTGTIGTGQLNSNGVATFSTTSLTLGTHSITAVYSGDTNNAPSTSTALIQVVKSGTMLAVVSNMPNATFPQTETFTATISSATTPVGGTVVFADGSMALGTIMPTAAGVAVLGPIALAPGQHIITATFSGDTNNLTSNGSVTQNVLQTPTGTTLGINNSTPTFGTPITLQATIVSTGHPPATSPLTGSVTFTDSITVGGIVTSTLLGTPMPVANGTSTLSVANLAPGVHTITASYSGDTDNASSSTLSGMQVTVAQIGTSAVVTASSGQANAGTSVGFTATVSIPTNTTAGGPLSGTITFLDNNTPISPAVTVTSIGNTATATFSSTFTPGPHSITVAYSGATNYAKSISAGFSLSVVQNTSTTALSTTTPNPSIAGQALNLTAVVSGPTGASTPTGTVTFSAIVAGGNSIALGPITLNASGQAILPPVTSLPPGTYQITASYSGDTDNKSSSFSINQSIKFASTTLTLTSATTSTQVGNPVTFTASLGSINDQPTGTVVFLDSGSPIGQMPLTGTSTIVTFSTTSLAPGPHSITASYGGDTDDSSATAGPVSVQIQKLPTSAMLVSNAAPGAYSQPITFTVTVASENVSPTGTVQFLDGTTAIGTASVIGSQGSLSGTASLTLSTLSLGNHSITANYLGDTNHTGIQSNTLSQQVLQNPGVIVTSNNSSTTAGQTVALTASVTGVQNLAPTGTITFKDGGSILGASAISPSAGTVASTGVAVLNISSLAPGTHSVVASYSGDTDYSAANSPAYSQKVIIANTTVAIASSVNPATFNTPLTFTANVTGTGGTVSGTVTFMDGSNVIEKATLNNNGVATLVTSALAPGQHTITATYSGDTDNQPNTSSGLQQQIEQTTTTTIVSSENPAQTLDSVSLTCTVNTSGTQHATGSVTFTDGSTLLGTVALDGNGQAVLNLPPLPAGQHSIVANYSGDVADFPSTSTPFSQSVQLRPTTDVLTATTTSLTDNKQLTLISVLRWTGSVAPTGTVNFTIGNNIIGTTTVNNIGVATLTIILDPGAATVVASYSGDSVYAASNSPATGIADGPPTSFTLQLSNSTLTLQSKQNTKVTVNITSLNGFSDTLKLGCLGLPYAASCTFSTAQTTLQANGTQTINLVIDTSAPLLAGTNVNASGFAGGTKQIILPALLSSLFAGLLLMRSRKRHPLVSLLALLCAIVLTTGLSGCGTLNVTGTPAGTYTFKVTASGTNTGITQTTNVTLTVQQ